MTRPIAYDDAARSYVRHRVAQAYAIETLARIRARAPRAPLLEVGCGTGEYVESLCTDNVLPGFGMDASRGMLAQAPAQGRIAYLQGTATRLPFADQSLGMIFSINVIHHVTDVRAYMREAYRALAPGGVVCTATDSEAIIRRREPLSRYWPATVAAELERYHPIETLRDEMTAAHFRALQAEEAGAEFVVDDAAPYRDKAYSCLDLIGEEEFHKGLNAIEDDLRCGPLTGVSELVFLWGERA